MEININCDLGEKSKLHNNENDPYLLGIVNSANVACGYHAGDEETMDQVIKISKENGVSIGAHPSFDDPDNFGRKRMNLSSSEVRKLIIDQYEILQRIAFDHNENVTHIKPHGALNNMACEDLELATTIAKAVNEIGKDIIYLVPTGSKMEIAAKKLNMKIACEIFADRNYEDDGNLVSRSKPNALITDPEQAKKHVLSMVQNQALNCLSGKQIPCEIDSVCIHGDNESSLSTAKSIKENLIEKLTIKSKNDNSFFNVDSLSLLYTIPKDDFLLIVDNEKNVYLTKVVNFNYKNFSNSSEEGKIYISRSNFRLKNNISNSYDDLLNTKYKVKINQNTLERLKNYFK